MEISKILLCIVVTAVCVRGKEADDDDEALRNCRKEIGYPDSFYPSYNPIEKKEKCFIACLMEKDGMMVNGKLFLHKMNTHLTENYPDNLQNTRKILMTCVEEANKSYDKCEVAASVIKCFGRKGKPPSHKKD